jgi:hypothetical protein
VPGLGLLALTRVPAAQQSAAAGLFFAWFDAGVGLGGPAVRTVASLPARWHPDRRRIRGRNGRRLAIATASAAHRSMSGFS